MLKTAEEISQLQAERPLFQAIEEGAAESRKTLSSSTQSILPLHTKGAIGNDTSEDITVDQDDSGEDGVEEGVVEHGTVENVDITQNHIFADPRVDIVKGIIELLQSMQCALDLETDLRIAPGVLELRYATGRTMKITFKKQKEKRLVRLSEVTCYTELLLDTADKYIGGLMETRQEAKSTRYLG